MSKKFVLAIDPGREKCGLAVVDRDGAIVSHAIVTRGEVVGVVRLLVEQHGLQGLAIGHATASRAVEEELKAVLPTVNIVQIDETGSTLEARAVYWQENPPKAWRRLVPLSLQNPPVSIDDYAAVVLARRALGQKRVALKTER